MGGGVALDGGFCWWHCIFDHLSFYYLLSGYLRSYLLVFIWEILGRWSFGCANAVPRFLLWSSVLLSDTFVDGILVIGLHFRLSFFLESFVLLTAVFLGGSW